MDHLLNLFGFTLCILNKKFIIFLFSIKNLLRNNFVLILEVMNIKNFTPLFLIPAFLTMLLAFTLIAQS
jgi:hypothetical protein